MDGDVRLLWYKAIFRVKTPADFSESVQTISFLSSSTAISWDQDFCRLKAFDYEEFGKMLGSTCKL